MAWTIHRTALARMIEEHLNGQASPDPLKFYLILTNGVVITDQSTIAVVAAAELAPSNGYARMPYIPGVSAYDATQSRHEVPQVTTSITATGAGLQYDTAVLISDANPTVGDSQGNIEFFQSVGSTSIPALGTGSFIISFNAGGNGVDLAAV